MHQSCPKCGYRNPPGRHACDYCGLTMRARKEPPIRRSFGVESPAHQVTMGPDDVKIVLGGGGCGLLLFLIPLAQFVVSYLVILVHEMGHMFAWWGFGFPAVPAFDFTYGGGVTVHYGRHGLVTVVIFVALAVPLVKLKRAHRFLIFWGVFILAYTCVAFSQLRELVALAMGHGAELVFAGLCMYRGLSGSAVRHAIERPLYIAISVFITLKSLWFAAGLMWSESARTAYGEAKGGGHWMDFSRIAEMLGCDLGVVAFIFLVATAITPWLAWMIHARRETIKRRIIDGVEWLLASQ